LGYKKSSFSPFFPFSLLDSRDDALLSFFFSLFWQRRYEMIVFSCVFFCFSPSGDDFLFFSE